jgi:hypothetical protein
MTISVMPGTTQNLVANVKTKTSAKLCVTGIWKTRSAASWSKQKNGSKHGNEERPTYIKLSILHPKVVKLL